MPTLIHYTNFLSAVVCDINIFTLFQRFTSLHLCKNVLYVMNSPLPKPLPRGLVVVIPSFIGVRIFVNPGVQFRELGKKCQHLNLLTCSSRFALMRYVLMQ